MASTQAQGPALRKDERARALDLTGEALALSERLPEMVAQAQAIAATLIFGWHGRKRAGTGETFWQFRPFSSGEPAMRVDWRRSARDDDLYVRETEWEAAQTMWLWPDCSASMNFASSLSPALKRDRAIVLSLALSDILVRGGERVGLLGNGRPLNVSHTAERLAMRLLRAGGLSRSTGDLPHIDDIRQNSIVILCSDFLDPPQTLEPWLRRIADAGARAHLIQIIDPAEEAFPYSGRTVFVDPETGERIDFQQASRIRDAYREGLHAHRRRLQGTCRKLGWSFVLHHTDRSPTEPLLLLLGRLMPGAIAWETQ